MPDARVIFEAVLDHTRFDKDAALLKADLADGGWDGFKKNAEGALGKVISGIGKFGRAANVVVGGISTAVGGIAAAGGLNRAMGIEQAQAKLTGLGHSADEVSAIMDDALGSVRGTAYGLNDAATAAATLSAAGIETGKGVGQMEGVLSTVASTAAVSGREFGDVASIFSDVAANGHLTGDSLAQLQDSGIPVLQMLADHYGITAEAASEMVSDGQVDFQTFNAVMHDTMGTAAEAMGGTFQGQLANTKAALSRFGATALTPLMDAFTELAPYLQGAIDALASGIGPLMDDLQGPLTSAVQAASGALQSFTEWMRDADPAMQKLVAAVALGVGGFSSVSGVIGPLAQKMGSVIGSLGSAADAEEGAAEGAGILSKAMSALSGPAGVALAVVAAVAAAVIYLWNTNDDFRESVSSSLSGIQAAVSSLWSQAQPAISGAADAIRSLWSAVGPVLQQVGSLLLDVVAVAVETVADAVEALFGWLASVDWGSVAGAVTGVFSPLVEAVESGLDDIMVAGQNVAATLSPVIDAIGAALVALSPVFQGLMVIVGGFAELVASTLMPALQALAGIATTVLGAAFQLAATIVSTAMQAIAGVLTQVFGVIETMLGLFVGAFTGDWTLAADGASTIMQGMVGTITAVMNGLMSAISTIVNAIAGVFSSALGGVTGIVAGIFGTVSDTVSGLMGGAKTTVSDALDSIAGFFRGLKIEWPHINLPHFTINGEFNLDPLHFSVPTLGIEWYAKGGVFNGPTIAGLGEAGKEAAMPLQGRDMWPFADAVADRIAAAMGGSTGGGVSQTFVFNQPVRTPDEFARAMRMQERYGLGAMA